MEKRLTMVRQSYQLILSRDIDYQRILESDWAKGTPGHTQKRVVILDTTFPWWLSQYKYKRYQLVISIDIADQRWNKTYK